VWCIVNSFVTEKRTKFLRRYGDGRTLHAPLRAQRALRAQPPRVRGVLLVLLYVASDQFCHLLKQPHSPVTPCRPRSHTSVWGVQKIDEGCRQPHSIGSLYRTSAATLKP
jgi:hypothetical protein